MTTSVPTLDALRSRAADGMRGYIDHEGAARTLYAKDVAAALIDARAHFVTRDGEVDLLGRSRDYRLFVTSCLDEASIPREERASLQAAIRYHVSPMLRERYAEEVEAMGLEPGSTVERARRRKERDARILSLFSGGGEIENVADVSLVVNLARLALSRVTGFEADAPAPQKTRVRAEFKRLADALDAAMEATGASR